MECTYSTTWTAGACNSCLDDDTRLHWAAWVWTEAWEQVVPSARRPEDPDSTAGAERAISATAMDEDTQETRNDLAIVANDTAASGATTVTNDIGASGIATDGNVNA